MALPSLQLTLYISHRSMSAAFPTLVAYPSTFPPSLQGEGLWMGSATISSYDSRERQTGHPMFKNGSDLPGRVLWKILTKWPFNPSIIQKFCARKLLVENFRVLREFAKWLSFSRLWRIWLKMGIAGFKKSTPKKNLALPFYFSACLQNRERAPNRG